MDTTFRLLPAASGEAIVHGAERPGYGSDRVEAPAVREWLNHMRAHGIGRVCCLLTSEQLAYYADDLLEVYRQTFGEHNVCWAPVEDYHLCDETTLTGIILPFLFASDRAQQPVVVHCSGGLGRTGHVLAAWLAAGRGFEPQAALDAVIAMKRHPNEAVRAGNAAHEDLISLLKTAKDYAQRGGV